MKNWLNIQVRTSAKSVLFAAFALLIVACIPTFAQKQDATRRLYLAVDGYELNEAAAKDALAAGADINWKNDAMGGETMLIMALKGFKDAKVFRFLLDNGADASLRDNSGKTALEWAHQYNIGRDRNGKEILAMLEDAAGGAKDTDAEKTAAETKPTGTVKTAPTRTAAAAQTTAAKTTAPKRNDGSPSTDEVKAMIEKKMTSIYEDHFCCKEKNKVEFEWLAPVLVGGQETKGRIPTKCWAVKLDVKITFTKPSSGETGWVKRGVDGNPVKEMFCIFKDGFDEWDYLTYAP